jgi:hypothetical protein
MNRLIASGERRDIMMCSLATNVGEEQLAEIRALEQQVGATLLAYGCHELQPAKPNDEQLVAIKKLEDKLGVVLVAVES